MTYESNVTDVVSGINKKVTDIIVKGGKADRAQKEIAITLTAKNANRVFKDGINVNGVQIGQYSTKPTLIGASSFVYKKGVAAAFTKEKRKNSEWVTIKKRKLMVLKGGYKEIRNLDGFHTDKVILHRTGKMFKEFKTEPKNADWVIGFPKQYQSGLSYRAMIDNFEKKYNGLIWGVSKKEEEIVRKIVQKNINLA